MRELAAGGDAKLAVDPREVGLDRSHGDVELGGDLLVGPSIRDQIGDSPFRLGQSPRLRCRTADSLELLTRALDPERRAELVEAKPGVAQHLAGLAPTLRPPERHTVEEQRPCALEALPVEIVAGERRLEVRERLRLVICEQ